MQFKFISFNFRPTTVICQTWSPTVDSWYFLTKVFSSVRDSYWTNLLTKYLYTIMQFKFISFNFRPTTVICQTWSPTVDSWYFLTKVFSSVRDSYWTNLLTKYLYTIMQFKFISFNFRPTTVICQTWSPTVDSCYFLTKVFSSVRDSYWTNLLTKYLYTIMQFKFISFNFRPTTVICQTWSPTVDSWYFLTTVFSSVRDSYWTNLLTKYLYTIMQFKFISFNFRPTTVICQTWSPTVDSWYFLTTVFSSVRDSYWTNLLTKYLYTIMQFKFISFNFRPTTVICQTWSPTVDSWYFLTTVLSSVRDLYWTNLLTKYLYTIMPVVNSIHTL